MDRKRFAILDRDGTIIRERPYLADSAGVELLPGAAEGLRALGDLGFRLIIATNQSGIARGLFSPEDHARVNERMCELLSAHRVEIEAIYTCPHAPEDGCRCRKPATGLIERAAADFAFAPEDAVVIGDKAIDIAFGRAVRARTIFVRTGPEAEHAASGIDPVPDFIADDLRSAAAFLAADAGGTPQAPAADPYTQGQREYFTAKVRVRLLESARTKQRTAETASTSILRAAQAIVRVFRNGKKLLICGNGGSAADAQHMATEFTSILRKTNQRPALPAIALTTDTSFLTAYGNDFGFAGVFERQVEALGQPGDVLLAISTSGDSENVLRAAATAQARGITVIALTGAGGRLPAAANIAIQVPEVDTQLIQESHLAIEHTICELVEDALFG